MSDYPSTTIETPIGVVDVICRTEMLRIKGTVLLDTYTYTIRIDYFPAKDPATTARLPLRPGWVEITRSPKGRGTINSRETILKFMTEAVTRLVLAKPDVWGRAHYVDWVHRTQQDQEAIQRYMQYIQEARVRLFHAGKEPPSFADFTWRSSADVSLQEPLPNPE